ncbi:MAG: hypothetical protein KDD22_03235, partial [Bdellovibrionales bacterium]|nr:hypothetical protein [Bdellovibrionales bacterium]
MSKLRKKPTYKKKLMRLGLALIAGFMLLATFAPWISPQDPRAMNLPLRYQGPSWHHPFGLDENGGDVFAKVVYGARVSLGVALSVV